MEKDETDLENNENSEEFSIRESHQILTEILNEIRANSQSGQGNEALSEMENELEEDGETEKEKEGQKEEAEEKENEERVKEKEQKHVRKEAGKKISGKDDKADNEEEVKDKDVNENSKTNIPHKSKTENYEEIYVVEDVYGNKAEENFCIQNKGELAPDENDENIKLPCDNRFNVRVIEERINSVRITWDLLQEAETYKIEKFHRRRGWETVAWTGNGPMTIENLDENFCYRLRIKAQRFCGTHELFEDYKMSAEFMVTTLPPLPTTLSLHRAIKKGQQFLVKRILRRRPSLLDYPGPNGYLPLANAIISDQHSVIDVLLSHGANVHIGNPLNARTPLQLAFYYGRLAVARILLNRKAMLEATDINDMTACHFAVDANQLELLRFALENGANVNAIDACGWSVLSRAVVMRADVCILKLLLTFGADVKSKDKLNKTCVDLARIYKNTEAAEYFAKALK